MMVQTAKARTIKEANGAACRDCGAVFQVGTSPYWGWPKSKAMHEAGTGHKMDLWKIVGFTR